MRKVILCLFVLFASSHFAAWGALAQAPTTIEILKPLDRRNVSNTATQVTVQITGVATGDGHYWELWVDQEPVIGARNGERVVTVSFKPTGPHRLQAVLFDAQGRQLASSNSILVIAAPVQERTPQFNQQMMAPIMALFTLLVIVLIIATVWLSRRANRTQAIPIDKYEG